jgi:hypothetical protein
MCGETKIEALLDGSAVIANDIVIIPNVEFSDVWITIGNVHRGTGLAVYELNVRAILSPYS